MTSSVISPSVPVPISRPPYFSLITPYIIVKNIDSAVYFYEQAFNFVLKEKILGNDGSGSVWHAEMFYQDQLLMFGKEGAYGNPVKAPKSLPDRHFSPMNLYIYCSNLEDYYKQAIKAGAIVLSKPEIAPWGDKLCQLQCPEGYIWTFAVYIGGTCQAKQLK